MFKDTDLSGRSRNFSISAAGGALSSGRISAVQGRPVAGLITSPTGFATTRAPTTIPSPTFTLAEPTPPLSVPALAPAPAPTAPHSGASSASSAAR
ncbi:Uncharacterised protein [Mycobacteroides abscessus subsp. abscessus]|nr:Uncharacterised protein [Mycobacteroides abscessus subsp. abscessus]